MRAHDFARGLLRSLARERARTGLTVAGIAVGSFAVAILVSLGAAIKQAISGSLRSLGENLIIVTPEPPRSTGPGLASALRGPTGALSELDAVALRALPSVELVSSVVTAPCIAGAGAEAVHTTCVGVDAGYLDVARIALSQGGEFAADAATSPRAQALLGETARRRLFADADALGRPVQVGGRRVRVLGVARARGAGVGGADEDDFILVPKAFARQQLAARSSATQVDAVFVLARTGHPLDDTIADIRAELARRRRVQDVGDTLSVASLAGLMATSLQASELLTFLLAGMAAISVLVGGVGIVNVMLTSVAERRLEIGLKLALGAAPRTIALEFLVEAVALAAAGAFIGLAGAEALALLLSLSHGLAISLTPAAALLALGLALGVGTVAGAWPAQRASQLNPREILRDA